MPLALALKKRYGHATAVNMRTSGGSIGQERMLAIPRNHFMTIHTRLRRRQHGCVSTISKDDVLDDAAVLTPENESPRAGKNNSLLRRDALFSDAIIDSNISDDENVEFCIFSDLFLQVALLG